MPSWLHTAPLEILCLICRHIPPHDVVSLASVDKTTCNRLALSSPFREDKRLIPFDYFHPDPHAYTNAHLWADIFTDNFSSSAVARRSFRPGVNGFATQLIYYSRVLRWIRRFPLDSMKFGSCSDPFEDTCLELIFLLLVEDDGKNMCQLESAGAYEYCQAWLRAKLYAKNNEGRWIDSWPREDRYASYALWSLWLLTSHDRIANEHPQDSVLLKDLVFRFSFASYLYPMVYAPLSRYNLPLGTPGDAPFTAGNNATPHPSIANAVLNYPPYRSPSSNHPRSNTAPSQIPYYGSVLSWTPPLATSAAKLLYLCRTFPAGMHPGLPATRQQLLAQRSQAAAQAIANNPVLGVLYELTQIHGVPMVRWMMDNDQLPPDVSSLPGVHQAMHDLASITGVLGFHPSEAIGLTVPYINMVNAHREAPFPFRGGWNEDGVDPRNRRWSKLEARDPTAPLPPPREIRHLGLPYECSSVSSIHDSLFWRLSLCGDPWKQDRGISSLLRPEDLQNLHMSTSLRDRSNRIMPGRPFRPGLLNGLFQGVWMYTPEHWLQNSYRQNTFDVRPIGENITAGVSPQSMHMVFYARFQEHHQLLQSNNLTVPFTCDARVFPRNVVQPGQASNPLEAFADSINPGDEWAIDEGGMNAFLPDRFRAEPTTSNGHMGMLFGWGPRGIPSPDRCTEYETFIDGQPSSHSPALCPGCGEVRDYSDHLEMQRQHIEDLYSSVGMTPPSHSPSHFSPCDGIRDIVITGETDLEIGQNWHHYHFLGRIRMWDGLVCILRIPKNMAAGHHTQLFYGYHESDTNFVGGWRLVNGNRLNHHVAFPHIYNPAGGLSGDGLIGNGGAGVLGDGMRVVQEGPFVMAKVVEE
ncbi:hypothetical protein DL96DRAFT_88734 [Flagelloscypha sp. PMI_526]|nr:hypothetical protein DL96DRAFT_88734 [Flagelloscypha sp. PMI_526]